MSQILYSLGDKLKHLLCGHCLLEKWTELVSVSHTSKVFEHNNKSSKYCIRVLPSGGMKPSRFSDNAAENIAGDSVYPIYANVHVNLFLRNVKANQNCDSGATVILKNALAWTTTKKTISCGGNWNCWLQCSWVGNVWGTTKTALLTGLKSWTKHQSPEAFLIGKIGVLQGDSGHRTNAPFATNEAWQG